MAATMLGSDYVLYSQIFAGLFMEAQFKFHGFGFDINLIICDDASFSLHARLIGSATRPSLSHLVTYHMFTGCEI